MYNGMDISVDVTVYSVGKPTPYGKGMGQKVTGVVNDSTGKIDFISWNDCVEIVREHLQEGRRVTMKNVRVKTAKAQFFTTSSGMQLLITKSTTFEEVNGQIKCV